MQLGGVLELNCGEPPPLVRQLSHRVRWRLMCELASSDRAVGELIELVGEQQSLVSYHLGQLRSAGLVQARRSSADRRDSYYSVDLAVCREQLYAAGGALHPGLASPAALPPRSRDGRRRTLRVLFLCTGNSARSQIAEALLESMSQGAVKAASAGSHPKPLHPDAVRVMRQRGIDISGNRSKHLDEFVAERFDLVVTLCDRVREVCPEFAAHPEAVHWSIANPALKEADDGASLPAFERTATELETRIRFLLARLEHSSTRRSTDG